MSKTKRENIVLTPENIQSENSKFEKTRKVNFKSGGYTEVDIFFKPQKIQAMIVDFSEFVSEIEKRTGKKIEENDEFHLYFTLHIIKHFTSICPIFPSDFAEKLDFLNKLAKHPCVFELKDVFDAKQIAKIYEQMMKQLDDYSKLMKQDRQLREKFEAQINKSENADIIRSVMFGEDVGINGDSELDETIREAD